MKTEILHQQQRYKQKSLAQDKKKINSFKWQKPPASPVKEMISIDTRGSL